MLKRDVAVMKKDIDLDLPLLSVRMKPGEALTQKRGWAPPFGGPTFPSSTRKKAKYCQ